MTEDTIIKKTNTSYLVVKDIFVPPGVTLTVEAGVELKFQHGGITVEGNRFS